MAKTKHDQIRPSDRCDGGQKQRAGAFLPRQHSVKGAHRRWGVLGLSLFSLSGCLNLGGHVGYGTGGINSGVSVGTEIFSSRPSGNSASGHRASGRSQPQAWFPSVEACLTALSKSTLQWRRVSDIYGAQGCAVEGAVQVAGSSNLRYSQVMTVTCEMAHRLSVFENKLLQPAAQHHFGRPVREIKTVSGYSCRRIRGTGKLSQHAFGKAIDITGFTLEGGRQIALPRDWGRGDKAAAFMRDLHKNSCRLFHVSLGPEADADHRDHFHFDIGPSFYCR